jgi:phosphatidylglycerophosphatase C
VTTTVVAAFDFDGTLTRSDSVVPFLQLVAGRRALATGLARRGHRVAAALAHRDRDRLRALATEIAFVDVSIATVESQARAYGRDLAENGLRADTVERLAWHVGQGHRVVIVSASYEQYVRVVGERLGVSGVVATRLEVGSDGRCTGRLDGRNCRAAEKLRRLDIWLAEQGLARAEVELWAYGDTSGDRELLDAAQHPVWVTGPLDSVAPTSA